MPAKRRGEADARALLRKFGRALDSDDSPTRVRRPGGSGLAAVRSAVSTTTSATAPTSWVAAWGLVPHLPALKKSGPRRSARATPAAVSFRGSIASVACGPAGVVVISEENHAVAAPAEGGRRKVGCRAQSAAVGETVALILNDQSLYAVDPSRDAPRNGSWERPRRLDPFAGAPPFAQARTITGVACGSNHCLARSSCGAVFAWGAGDAGQLGDDDGHDITRAHPTAIVFPADYEPCERGALSAGAHHSALVDGAGALWTWGWTEHGRLGRDSVEEDEDDGRVAGTPGIASLPGGGECIDVSCGAAHTIVVDNNGFVSGCGWNEWGQATGRMNCSSVWHLTPVRFKVPFSAIKVACGLGHSIAVDSNGNAKSWGFGEDGQLGFGREAEKSSPVDVDLSKAGLRNGPACVASIACGGSASVAVVAEAVGSDLEMLRRRRLAIRRVSLYLQALYRGKRARRFYREMLEEELQDRLRRLRRMTDLGIDSRDPTPIKQALESFEDDVGEDSQRAREALRRLACRSQLEEALSNGDDDAAVALVDLAPDHDGDIDALRSGGRRPPRALAGVLCEDAAELCGMQQSVESWRDDLVGYREAKLRLAERSQRELTAAVKLQLWWRGSLATRLALAELFRLRQRRTNAERVEAERRAKRDAEDQYNAATACQSIFRGRAARSARDAEVARRLGIRADAASTLCNFARNWRARRYLKRLRARARRLAREAAKRRERELAERLAAKQKQPRKRTVPKKRDPMHADAVAAARAAREAGQYLKKLEAQDRKAAEEAAQNARQALDAARMKRDRDRRSRLAAKRRAEAEARALAEQQAKLCIYSCPLNSRRSDPPMKASTCLLCALPAAAALAPATRRRALGWAAGAAAGVALPRPAAAADLNSWNKKLDKLGLPPLDKIPGGFAPVLSSVNQEQSLFVEFLRPDGWLVVKPSVNTNGEDGTVSAGDYGKGDSAALYVSDLRPATDKAYYAKLLKGGIAQKGGGELYQEFKVRKVTPGAPTTVDFSYELLTGAGFIVERRGVAAVTDVNGKSQALLAVTTSARFKGLEPKLRTIADSFRCYEKVGSVPTDTFGLED